MENQSVFDSLCEVVPGGVNSPIHSLKCGLANPVVATSAKGDLLTDSEGNTLIDYVCSWGAMIHGHAHPQILEAATKQMAKGTTYGMASLPYGELAREVRRLAPHMERIRFVSSGTEATMSAIRLARGYTKRDAIIKFTGNYHGHADMLLAKAGSNVAYLPEASSAGVPAEAVRHTHCIPYNDTVAFRKACADLGETLAAVIVEPIAGNMGVVKAEPAFLQALRDETKNVGAILIYDEVMSGFRTRLNPAPADITCLGKIVGGGFPAAAFGGKQEIMETLAPTGPVFQAGTLSGNPVAMVAGLESLKLCKRPGFYADLEKKTRAIVEPLQEVIRNKNACVNWATGMFTLYFGIKQVRCFEDLAQMDTQMYDACFRHMLKNGVYMPPAPYEAWFISDAHTDAHLEHTSEQLLNFLLTRD